MTLKEFIKEQQLILISFEKYWELANITNTEHFPINMGVGEWDEQLKFFDAVFE